jgi:geranylgeranyl diphosphate synthase type II
MPEIDLEKELALALAQGLARGSAKDSNPRSKSESPTPRNLAESIRYSLLAPGKRIRPRLALAAARMIGLDTKAALPAGLAIEMIHCFTLIHDDLPCMDDDDVRRGRPSNHKAHGEAIALLAGDALMMLALETLAEAAPYVRPENFMRALKRFAWASGPRGVIGGQAAESLLGAHSRIEELALMHAQKTGALFSASLLLPKDLAGITELGEGERSHALERFAAQLGLAFQVADDLEDGEKEAALPTSILFYLTADEARSQTLQGLEGALSDLQKAWGPPATSELAAITAEVIRALKGNLRE